MDISRVFISKGGQKNYSSTVLSFAHYQQNPTSCLAQVSHLHRSLLRLLKQRYLKQREIFPTLYGRADNMLKTMVSLQCCHTPSSPSLSAPSWLRGGLPSLSQVQQFPSGGPSWYMRAGRNTRTAWFLFSTSLLGAHRAQHCPLNTAVLFWTSHVPWEAAPATSCFHTAFSMDGSTLHSCPIPTWSKDNHEILSLASVLILKGLASHQELTFSILSFINIVYTTKAHWKVLIE